MGCNAMQYNVVHGVCTVLVCRNVRYLQCVCVCVCVCVCLLNASVYMSLRTHVCTVCVFACTHVSCIQFIPTSPFCLLPVPTNKCVPMSHATTAEPSGFPGSGCGQGTHLVDTISRGCMSTMRWCSPLECMVKWECDKRRASQIVRLLLRFTYTLDNLGPKFVTKASPSP